MTLLLAPRQLGSQGGSSSALSQSYSTRDLARFMRPRARARHPLRPVRVTLASRSSVSRLDRRYFRRSDAQTVAIVFQRLMSV